MNNVINLRKSPKKVTSEIYSLPSFWAGALINGEYDALNDEEIEQLNNWLKRINPGVCAEISDESYFGWFQGLGHDLSDFTFIS